MGEMKEEGSNPKQKTLVMRKAAAEMYNSLSHMFSSAQFSWYVSTQDRNPYIIYHERDPSTGCNWFKTFKKLNLKKLKTYRRISGKDRFWRRAGMNLPNKETVPIRTESHMTINLITGENTEVREPPPKSKVVD